MHKGMGSRMRRKRTTGQPQFYQRKCYEFYESFVSSFQNKTEKLKLYRTRNINRCRHRSWLRLQVCHTLRGQWRQYTSGSACCYDLLKTKKEQN